MQPDQLLFKLLLLGAPGQKSPDRSFRSVCAMRGVCLGFAAPLGALVLATLFSGTLTPGGLADEIGQHSFYFLYMTLTTPVFFGVFGFFIGYFLDNFSSQKSSLEQLNFQLKEQSVTDDVTGLFNHRYAMIEIEKELERAARYKRTFSGMMIDIDDFKHFNDSYGHLVGDYILKEVSMVLAQSVRRIDVLGRYGGDEFIIILPEAAPDTAKSIAERIHNNIQQHTFKVEVPQNILLTITVSIGLASFQDTPVDKKTFVEKVDRALLTAKSLGKNRIHVE